METERLMQSKHTNLVLSHQEGQQHQHASVMNHPPHINSALPKTVLVGGETVHILSHQQGLVGCGGLTYRLWTDSRTESNSPVEIHHKAERSTTI